MTVHDSWHLEREAFLSSIPPRNLSGSVPKSVLRDKYIVFPLVFGLLFLAFGLPFAPLVPTRIYAQYRLDNDPCTTTTGEVLLAEETFMRIDRIRVWAYHFTYQATDGLPNSGRAYTTGSKWKSGDVVNVDFLNADPNLAVISGARLDVGTASSLAMVLIFPIIGCISISVAMILRHRKTRLLRNGHVASATIHQIEPTSSFINHHLVYNIHLTIAGLGTPQIKRSHHPDEIARLRGSLESACPEKVLYDPGNPGNLMFPLSWVPGSRS